MKIKRILILSMLITLFSCGNDSDVFTPVELIPFESGYTRGYMNWDGEVVINPQFSEANLFYDFIALVRTTEDSDRRYGYIDTKGNYLIQPEFTQATNFNDGIAVTVRRNEFPKGIDRKGKVLFELKQAKTVKEFREGFAAFSVEIEKGKTLWGFIDKKGKTVIEPQFSEVSFFSEGKCAVSNNNDKWGYINTKGEFIVNPRFTDAQPFVDGKAVIREDRKRGVIDEKGKYLLNPQFKTIIPDGDLYLVESVSGYYGWTDKKGVFIINPQFDKANVFGGNKLAPVSNGYQWGYINKKGQFEINPQFRRAFPFLKGKAIVSNSGVAIIDNKGKYLTNPQFDDVSSTYYAHLLLSNPFLTEAETDYFDITQVLERIKKEITPTSMSGLDFSMSISEIINVYKLKNFNFYSEINLFSNKGIGSDALLSLNANGNFHIRNGWSFVLNRDALVDDFVYRISLSGKAFGKDEDLLREMESSVFKGFEKIANPAEGKVQYKNDNFLITVDSNSSQITLKIIPVSKAVVQTLSTGSEKPIIDPKWVTLPTDKEFRWMKWEDAPETIKDATKYVPFGSKSTLYENIQIYLDANGSPQGVCDVQIALTDLNENGIYGFAVSASGSPNCCGYAGHGCSYNFIEDGGVLYSELGQDHEVSPGKGKVIASTGKEFPFKSNNNINSQKQYQLKEYFRYK